MDESRTIMDSRAIVMIVVFVVVCGGGCCGGGGLVVSEVVSVLGGVSGSTPVRGGRVVSV